MVNGSLFADSVEYATGFFERMKGLLGRGDMNNKSAMIIEHCNSVHSVGMRFAIDLIFLDKEWRVLSVRENISPGKPMVGGGFHAKRVVESKTGNLEVDKLQAGDVLVFEGN